MPRTRPNLAVALVLASLPYAWFLATLVSVAPAPSAQQQTWSFATSAGPPARFWHAMAFDEARGVVVLYGGYDGSDRLADTWTWDGETWTEHAVAGPPARRQHAMAYDRARSEVVLFGGDGASGWLDDTWTWNGASWTQRAPAQAPPRRRAHALAYDSNRQQIVLFGGSTLAQTYSADTWTWAGASWTPRFAATNPPGRYSHAMAHDSARGETVLFGGSASGAPRSDDTWIWNGVDWGARAPATKPQGRFGHALAYDSVYRVVVLFQGEMGSTFPTTHWWDGNTWVDMSLPSGIGSPPHRYNHAMAYDLDRNDVVMFGGDGAGAILGDTWLHSTPRLPGLFTAYGQGCHGLSLSAAQGHVPTVGESFASRLDGVPPTALAGFMTMGFSNNFIGPIELPLSLAFLQMPGCFLLHDLFATDPTVALNGTTGEHQLTVPDLNVLVGFHAYVQALVVVPGLNPRGLIASNGGDLLIGN